MQTIVYSGLFAAFLFAGILGCLRLGWHIGRQRLRITGDEGHAGLGALDGAVFGLMGLLVLLSGLFAGFGMAKAGRQSPLHLFGFATIMALSIYLILDIEYPRLGLVRVDSFDQALIELRATMN